MKKSVLLLLSCLLWSIASLAQHPVGIWKSGVTTIVNELDSIVFTGKVPTSPDAVGIWKGGSPNIISGPDSIVFNRDYLIRPEGLDLGVVNEPTETEVFLQTLSSDEESAEATVFTEEEKQRYDAMAEELLALYDTDEDGTRLLSPWRATDDEYAEDALTKGHDQKFGNLRIRQYERNIGNWGPTMYGGFRTFFKAFSENGVKYLLIVFRQKGGFDRNRRAFVKLGQLNNGRAIGKLGKVVMDAKRSPYVPIAKGQEYAYQRVCLDEILPQYGCANLFPLLITEVNGQNSGERNYVNAIFICTEPMMNGSSYDGDLNWAKKSNDFTFGTVDGVPVKCNTSIDEEGVIYYNLHGGNHQCVEFVQRYLRDFEHVAPKGYAKAWPHDRKGDSDFILIANNADDPVREGDIIVWDSPVGHIGVVIKTEPKKILVAHENGGDGRNAYAIGMELIIDNGKVRDLNSETHTSSVHKTEQPVYFYRVSENELSSPVIIPDPEPDPEPEPEPEPEPVKAMTCDVTSLDFGETTVGTERKLVFNVTNTGETTLTISSVSLQSGSVFSVSQGPASLGKGVGQGYNVTFKPTQEGTFTDKITIRTDAKDHPVWTINLTGKATVAEQWGEKKMVCSGVSDNTQYTLYKQPNLAKYRTNSAGTKFYQTRLIVDVTYQGVTVSSPVTSDVYIDPNGAQSIMALTYQGSMDSGMGMLVVFTSSKAEGNNNLMNGYAYITGYQSRTPMRMFFSTEQTEHVFENKNYGWYPTFFYDDSGTLAVRHFCPDNNKIIESYYDYPVWESYEMGTTTKSDYENFWKNLRKPQFLEQPDMPWY